MPPTGEKVQAPVRFGNNIATLATLTRTRPGPYVFSPAFADVAERLRDVGVVVDVLSEGSRAKWKRSRSRRRNSRRRNSRVLR